MAPRKKKPESVTVAARVPSGLRPGDDRLAAPDKRVATRLWIVGGIRPYDPHLGQSG